MCVRCAYVLMYVFVCHTKIMHVNRNDMNRQFDTKRMFASSQIAVSTYMHFRRNIALKCFCSTFQKHDSVLHYADKRGEREAGDDGGHLGDAVLLAQLLLQHLEECNVKEGAGGEAL